MYIYFKSIDSVLTCEEYPQIISVKDMKSNNKDCECNKWEKNDFGNGTFTLSFKYTKYVCNCGDLHNLHLENCECEVCYICRRRKTAFKEGDVLYLQNSGSMDIVCVNTTPLYCQLTEVAGYPDIYKWVNDDERVKNLIFALHIEDNRLSDADVSKKIDTIKESCEITFTDSV